VIAASRNFGAAQAMGEFVAFLDSDDVWVRDKVTRQMALLADSRIVLIASAAWLLNENEVRGRTFVGISPRGFRDYTYEELIQDNAVHTSSALVRRVTFVEVAGFDESRGLICVEDYDLWLRIARTGKVRVLGEPLIYYRMHRDGGRNRVEEAERALRVIEKHIRLGYVLDGRVSDNARATIYRGMAKAASGGAAKGSRDYYRTALMLSSTPGGMVKAALGYVASYLPLSPRRTVDCWGYGKAVAYQALERWWRGARRVFKRVGYSRAALI
jgi:GT2 family glycosyltransferase